MGKPRIEEYLRIICSIIIDEMNQVYNGYDKEQLKEAADENFNELDLTVLMGYPFRHNARYTGNENKSKKSNYKGNYDLFIKTRGFKIEVKFLKNWRSEADTLAASKNWKPFLKDFNWLMNEIDTKGKGKVAFIIGWFNCVDYFSSMLQLGTGNGAYPIADENKICFFPFLMRQASPTKTRDLKYNYSYAYKELTVNPIGNHADIFNCMFLGSPEDKFHFDVCHFKLCMKQLTI